MQDVVQSDIQFYDTNGYVILKNVIPEKDIVFSLFFMVIRIQISDILINSN